MKQPAITKEPNTDFFYNGSLSENKQITEWSDNPLAQSTLERLQIKPRNTDTMIQTSKVFDNELNAWRRKEKSFDQIKEWREITEVDVFNTLGTEFIFTKTSRDIESIFVNRDPLTQIHKKSTVASLFNNKITNGLCHNTFFTGDILINSSETSDHPDIIIKSSASNKDKFEYE